MAPLPHQESARIAALHALQVLDSEPEPAFDSLARAASLASGTPVALISLVDTDRQWFKANHGLAGTCETPRSQAFCAHAILERGPLVVSDARADARFMDNPLVTGSPGIRFYAGFPLELPGGERVGTLGVTDYVTRQLDATQLACVSELAASAAAQLCTRMNSMGKQFVEVAGGSCGNPAPRTHQRASPRRRHWVPAHH